MKIAISSTGKDLESNVDSRFGRASGFIIYDLNDDSFEFVDNVQNLESAQGAGIQAAQTIINQPDVASMITGHCGPKAFKLLSMANIKIFTGANCNIKEAVDKYKNNELEESKEADVEGHWI